MDNTFKEEVSRRIGMLRQALNEDRITDPQNLVDNDYIRHWLDIDALLSRARNEVIGNVQKFSEEYMKYETPELFYSSLTIFLSSLK